MRRLPPLVLSASLLILAVRGGDAAAQEPAPATPEAPPPAPAVPPPPPARGAVMETSVAVQQGDVRRQGSDDVLSTRRELEVTSSLVFVTSRAPMVSVPELYFTDVGLWRTQVAASLSSRWRLQGGVGFLAKQPSTIDESFWQSAGLGVSFATTRRTALALGIDGGSLLHHGGQHGSVGLSFQARRRMNEFTSWEGRVGTSATKLFLDEGDDSHDWFAEADASGEVQLCWGPCRYRYGATWFGVDLAVPYFHPDSGALDPRTRLGVTLGSFVNVSPSWDMLVTLSWIDRGDAENPATQLPVLDGGFDQVQLGIGLIWHVSLDACKEGDRSPDCPRDRDVDRYE